MTQEYYSLERTAEVLNISTGEVNRMREQGQLRAFRDNATWKFQKKDVDETLANLIKKKNQQAEAEEDEILTFGLVEEDEDLPTLMAATNLSDTDDGLSLVDEEESSLGLGLDSDETFNLDDASPIGIDLGKSPEPDEDDLVLGGGSDLNLSGGSSISLVDESGEIGLDFDEDSNILAIADSEDDSDVPTMLADDGEVAKFDLVAEGDMDESESSSQVIALEGDDSFGPFGVEISDFGDSFSGESADFGAVESTDSFGAGGSSTDFGPMAAPVSKPAARSPYEATYSGKAVTALGLCCVFPVALAGLMIFDLVRYMWSWDQPASMPSPIIDMIIKTLPFLG